ncbi:MAG: hypothetical protein R3336_07550, partial [Phycisphaeraceae bacterium]|nr:hypothetical protein [Phycisphaeraceae bacterium]
EASGGTEPVSEDILARARRLYIQQKLVEADRAEAEGQYRLAADHYEEVLTLAPGSDAAKAGLARVESKISQAPRGVLGEQIAATRLRADAAVAEFRDLMKRAGELLASRSYTAALETVQQAKIVLDRNQRFLPTTRYQALREESVTLAARIDDARRVAEQQTRTEIEAQRQEEAQARRLAAFQKQQQEVQKLLRRAADLRREQKYDQALELLDQALFLDPRNIAGQAMRDMIADSQLYIRRRNLVRQRNYTIADQSNQNFRSAIPYTELMTYPPDWPELTAQRLGALGSDTGESEINQRVREQLQRIVPINFEATKLVNVIEFFRATTGANFFVNWSALENTGVEQDTPVTLELNNVPAEQALRLVLEQATFDEFNPVAFSVIEGIVHISTENDLVRTTATNVYDIRDLLVQVPSFEEAPEFDVASALEGGGETGGSGGGGGDSGGSIFGGGGGDDESGPGRDEMVTDIMELIRNTVGKTDEWAEFGGEVSSMRELNGNLIVRTTPANHRELLSLLGQLRESRAVQISVEARFLLVDQNFLDEVGVDLDFTIAEEVTQEAIPEFSINQDSVSIAEISSTSVPGSFGGQTNDGMNIGFDFLDNLELNLVLRATQAHRRSIALTAPRVTFFNGQRAYVTVARQVSFVSDLEAVPDGGGFNPTLSVVQSGVVLDVEGTVSADRRYVTLTVRPDLADIVTIREVEVQVISDITEESDDGTTLVEILTGFLELPLLQLTSVRTTVSVPDKGTLMLG